MLPIGYYYEGFNAEQGADVLIDVIRNHDYRHQHYLEITKSFLKTLSISQEHNILAHQHVIMRLMQR